MDWPTYPSKNCPPENSVRNDIEEIKQTATRAAALTQQLLAFSRKQIIRPRRVDLNEVILNLKKMLHRIIEEDIEIKITPDSSIAIVRMDANQIEQLILNVAVNARDAMPDGGTFTIQISATTLDDAFVSQNVGATKGKYVVLTLQDTGTGMTDEVKAHLFEPFFTTKEHGKGTGLGLATCYGIVKQNGGYITVESSVGQGTTFKIYFPRAEGRIEPYETQIRQGGSLAGSETLLVAEDDATVRRLAVRFLRAQGYAMLEAADGEQALEIVNGDKAKAIRLVLSDTVMPKSGGRKLAEEIKAIRPDVRIVFMSGYTDESLARQGVLDPEIDFVGKPFEPLILARKIREVLDR